MSILRFSNAAVRLPVKGVILYGALMHYTGNHSRKPQLARICREKRKKSAVLRTRSARKTAPKLRGKGICFKKIRNVC